MMTTLICASKKFRRCGGKIVTGDLGITHITFEMAESMGTSRYVVCLWMSARSSMTANDPRMHCVLGF